MILPTVKLLNFGICENMVSEGRFTKLTEKGPIQWNVLFTNFIMLPQISAREKSEI